jgi:nitroreductase
MAENVGYMTLLPWPIGARIWQLNPINDRGALLVMITTLTHNPPIRHSPATQRQSAGNDIRTAEDDGASTHVGTSTHVPISTHFPASQISERGLRATDLLNWRYATQKFNEDHMIDAEIWNEIEESLRLTPSAFGLQPWKFVVITDEKIKKQLQAISWNQTQPVECSHLLVLCRLQKLTPEYIDSFIELKARARNTSVESFARLKKIIHDFIEARSEVMLNEWMEKQCYIALGNLVNTAALLQVDSCPMEGLDPDAYDKLLGLPEKGCRTVVACALGYRAADDRFAQMARVRFSASELFIRI